MSARVIFENIQVKEGDLVENIPELILADDPYSLDKYELVSLHGIEMISSVRCHVLRNHDKTSFEDFD